VHGDLRREHMPRSVVKGIEEIAQGFGQTTGIRDMVFRLEGGECKRAFFHHGPVNASEMEAMFLWPEPPATS
jgi:hypothetical protein